MYDKKVDLTINGKEVETAEKQKPKFNADGIALSPDNAYLYYQAVLSGTLYRIATDKAARRGHLGKDDLSKAVEKVGASFPTDGFWMDKEGYLYQSDLRDWRDPASQSAGRRGGVGVRGPANPVAGFVCARAGWRDLFLVLAHPSRAAV